MSKTEHLKLALVFLLAFALRVNGLGFGLPYVFHPDEHQYVEAGIAFLQDRETVISELEKYNNPPLFKSTLGFLYALYVHLVIPDGEEIPIAIDTQLWRTFFQYVGRFASVSASLLTVALLYALGKRLYGTKVGVLSAFFLAVSFLHVRESHFAVNDAPLTLLVVAGLYGAEGILRRGRWFDYLATGLVIGLAGATKYSGMALVSVLPLAHWLRHSRSNSSWTGAFLSPRLLLSVAMVPVGFVVGAPLVLISWQEMIRRMGRLAEYGRFGYHDILLDTQGGWIFYLETLGWGAGWLMLAAFLAVLVLTLIYRPPEDLILLAFPLLLYATMGHQKMYFARFILPALPALLLLVAAWMERVWRTGHRLTPATGNQVPLIVPAVLVAFQVLATSVWFGILLNRPDTRELAEDWVSANIPPGSVTYMDVYALPRQSVTGRVSLPYVKIKEQPFDYPDLLGYCRDRGAQFIITSDFSDELRYTDIGKEEGRRRWLAGLSQLRLVHEIQPYWLPGPAFSFELRTGPSYETLRRQNPGPVIRIYELGLKPNWHGLNPFVESNQIPGIASVFGYEVDPNQVLPKTSLHLTIYWLNDGWRASDDLRVSLIDDGGFEITRAIARPIPGFEGELQATGHIVKSEAQLLIPLGTPPGGYQVQLSVFDRDKLHVLGTLAVEEARIKIDASVIPAEVPGEWQTASATLAPGISLAAYELFAPDIVLHDTLVLGRNNWMILLWRADRNIDVDYRVQLTLTDGQGNVAAIWEGQPVHGNYSTLNWKAGELIRDPWNLRLPETIIPGTTYSLGLTLFDGEDKKCGVWKLGTVQASSRSRSSAVPAMQHVVDATWADAIELLGFDVRAIPNTSNSGWLELDLFWRSLAPVAADYLVVIRLVDSRGQTVLAQEGDPAGGRAPTSTWQQGEVVQDFHSLAYQDLPMGEKYRLEVILTDPQTGEHLSVEQGGNVTDFITLVSWP